VAAGQDGIWDFALTFDESAQTAGVYCIKATTATGEGLNGGYSQIPAIKAPTTSLSQSSYRWYNNANNESPGAPLAAQDSAATITPESQFRLRQLMRADNNSLNMAQKFKLQYAEKSATCSLASPYVNLLSP